jgi:hypothetical protein
VLEDRVQRAAFEPKMEEVTGGWRKFDIEEFHNFLPS